MSATSATRLRVTFIGLTYVHLAMEYIIYRIHVHVRHQRLAMSNQRSFKIGSFRFAAFVPKKIECKRF